MLRTPSKKIQGIQHYTVKHYQDLNPLLGQHWLILYLGIVSSVSSVYIGVQKLTLNYIFNIIICVSIHHYTQALLIKDFIVFAKCT